MKNCPRVGDEVTLTGTVMSSGLDISVVKLDNASMYTVAHMYNTGLTVIDSPIKVGDQFRGVSRSKTDGTFIIEAILGEYCCYSYVGKLFTHPVDKFKDKCFYNKIDPCDSSR